MESLVSTEWLAGELGAADLVIIDATRHLPASGRDGAAEYTQRHIPGARFLDLSALADPASPVGRTLPGAEQAARVLGALGLSRDKRIVLYDDSAVKTAARAWFILTGYGFDEVAILDGGLAKWQAEGRPLESGTAMLEASSLSPQEFRHRVRRKADMLANIAGRAEQVVDARDAGRFTGATLDAVHDLPGGHIPGARNLFFGDLFAQDGTFLPRGQLAAALEKAGIDPARPFVASCGSGVTASVVLFAAHLLGHRGALYDGSWSEWGADPATPKATGPT